MNNDNIKIIKMESVPMHNETDIDKFLDEHQLNVDHDDLYYDTYYCKTDEWKDPRKYVTYRAALCRAIELTKETDDPITIVKEIDMGVLYKGMYFDAPKDNNAKDWIKASGYFGEQLRKIGYDVTGKVEIEWENANE